MPSRGCTIACLCLCLSVTSTAVFAQAGLKNAPLILVAPGQPDQVTLAANCPSFSWAPGDAVAGYELAVFEVTDGALATTPRLHVSLPARAAAWSPALTDCLPSGQEYKWFMREIGRPGRLVSEWSPGLRFAVASVEASAESEESSGTRAVAAASGSSGKPENPGPPPGVGSPLEMKLDELLVKVNQLLDPVTRQFCLEGGAELAIGPELELKLKGQAEGKAGAEAFGNGFWAGIRANLGANVAGELKGAGEMKWSRCVAIGAAAATSSNQSVRRLAAVSNAGTLSDEDLTTKMMTLAEQLQLNDARLGAIADLIPAFSSDFDPWSAARPRSALTDMAEVLPLPEAIRTTLRDPAQILAGIRSKMALCGQSGLPPAITQIIGEFCEFAQKEPFRKLLNNVGSAVTDIKSAVDGIVDRLPIAGNCKLFCN